MDDLEHSYYGAVTSLIFHMENIRACLDSVPKNMRPFVAQNIGDVIFASNYLRERLESVRLGFETTGADKQDPRLPSLLKKIE